MSIYDPSSDLWTLLYDLDEAINACTESEEGLARRELLKLQRQQVRIMLRINNPNERPDVWRD